MSTVTVDSISLRGAGIATIAQPAKGHRFTLDSILLADYCRLRARDRVLEGGAGTGIISLLLARRYPRVALTAVEVRQDLADLCRWNAHINGVQDRLNVLSCDIRSLGKHLPQGSFDSVVVNPPYQRSGTGRSSPVVPRRTAREAVHGGIAAWFTLGTFLRNGGRFFIVFPAQRSAEILCMATDAGLEPKRLQFVHAGNEKAASRFLLEAVKSAKPGVSVLPPLFVQGADGKPSRQLSDIYRAAF